MPGDTSGFDTYRGTFAPRRVTNARTDTTMGGPMATFSKDPTKNATRKTPMGSRKVPGKGLSTAPSAKAQQKKS